MVTSLFSLISALYFLHTPISITTKPNPIFTLCELQKDRDMKYMQILQTPCFNETQSFANIKWHTLHIRLSGASGIELVNNGELLENAISESMYSYFTKLHSKTTNNAFFLTIQIDSKTIKEQKYIYKTFNNNLAKALAALPLNLEVVLIKKD